MTIGYYSILQLYGLCHTDERELRVRRCGTIGVLSFYSLNKQYTFTMSIRINVDIIIVRKINNNMEFILIVSIWCFVKICEIISNKDTM